MMFDISLVFICLFVHEIAGHGMMLDPPNRSSIWRYNSSAIPNYNDNENFCGGFMVQYEQNEGKCGICGDSYADPHPQKNENTGEYGQGIIGGIYEAGSVIDISILLTANHLGEFTYSICELKDPNAPESGEECFTPLLFEDGSERYIVHEDDYEIHNRIQLPDSPCERCVLRWTYKCGNNWGVCDDLIWRPGCGPQEHFRSCSDIVIQ
ncbi:unnamed protein product [Phaedon cochleariae]|uniref:Chitin-binding type-4 domain-containing protein n=1 Tax=Phaedon cochleariae TaxID=80249 RepID=A0A9P0DU23_PHACE|nr:unnamed protein product [Phaedon cochleariae]